MEILEALKQTSLKNKGYVDDNFAGAIYEESYPDYQNELKNQNNKITIYGNSIAIDNVCILNKKNIVPYPYNIRYAERNGVKTTSDGRHILLSGTNTSASTYSNYIILDASVDPNILGKEVIYKIKTSLIYDGWLSLYVFFKDSEKNTLLSKSIPMQKLTDSLTFTVPEGSVYFDMRINIPTGANVDGFVIFPTIYESNAVVTDLGYKLSEGQKIEIASDDNFINSDEYKNSIKIKADTKEYVDNHSGSVTPDDIYSLLTYLTPEQYGAVGNGIADDTIAIKKCIQESVEKNLPIIANKKYVISSTLILDTQQNYDFSYVKYTGTDYAFLIKESLISLKIGTLTCNNGAGVLIHREEDDKTISRINLEIDDCYSKKTCIHLKSTTNQGVYYSKIRFNKLYSLDEYCVYLNTFGRNEAQDNQAVFGGVNEISIYGGLCNGGEYAAVIEGSGNCFYNISLEGRSMRNGFKFTGATNNIFGLRHAEFDIDRTKKLLWFTGKRAAFNNVYTNYPVVYDMISVDGLDYDDTFDNRPAHNRIYAQIIGSNSFELGSIGLAKMGKVIVQKDYTNGSVIVSNNMSFDEKLETTYALPTIFIAGSNQNKIATLGTSYCSDGINFIKVIQDNDNKISIYTKDGENIFDGSNYGNGTYFIECHATGYTNGEGIYYYGRSESTNMYDEWIVIPVSNPDEFTLSSPNGTKYKLSINDDGIIKTTLVEEV